MVILVFVFIGCLALGMMNNVKMERAREVCARQRLANGVPEYNLFLVLLTGLAAIVAFITAILGKYVVTVAAVAATILIPISYILDAVRMLPRMKEAGWGSGGMLSFQPWWVWARIVLLGMGKWMRIVMYCTLVGIPLYHMVENTSASLEDMIEQAELRQEYERLRK